MLVGAVGFLALLALLGFTSVRAIVRQRHKLTPLLTRVDDSQLACEDEVDAHVRELRSLGFAPAGTYAFTGNEESAGQRAQAFATYLLSSDGRTEAQVILSRVISAPHGPNGPPVAVSVCNSLLRSFTPDGRMLQTNNARGPLELFPSTPGYSSRTVRGDLRDVAAAHALDVAPRNLLQLDPAGVVEREERIRRDQLANWVARGLIRREGEGYVNTLRLGLRAFALFVVVPFGDAKDIRRAATIWSLATILAAVAAVGVARLDPWLTPWAASLVFAGLTTTCIAGWNPPSALSWGHACCAVAVVFHLLGVNTGWPWVAALFTCLLVAPVVLKMRNRRESALFEAAATKPDTPTHP